MSSQCQGKLALWTVWKEQGLESGNQAPLQISTRCQDEYILRAKDRLKQLSTPNSATDRRKQSEEGGGREKGA